MSRVTSGWDTNRRAAKDNITQALPVNISSIPINKPITQRAEEGHCFQMSSPKSKVIAPLSRSQCHSGNRIVRETIMRKAPAIRKNNAIIRVKAVAEYEAAT